MEPHYEKNLIINGRELVYKGILKADELFATLNRALEARGYQKREKKTEEIVTESGRRTHLELRPFKVKANYARYVLKIKITLDKVTEVKEEVKGEKRKFQQGDVNLIFDAWILTDYEYRWGMKPGFYFLKGLINKYLYKFPLEGGWEGELASDTAYVYGKIKNLLNSYRYQAPKIVPEEEVRKKMAEEIGKVPPA